MTLSSKQIDSLQILIRISSVLSIIGSSSIIIHFVQNPSKLRSSPFRNVFFLSVSDLLFSLMLFPGRWPAVSETMCELQGFLVQYFVISSILWSGTIATNMAFSVILRKPSSYLLKLEKIYHLTCWSIPLFLAFPWLFINWKSHPFYQDSQLWCWISEPYQEFRLYLFYIPLWIIYLFNLMTYLYVGRILWKSTKTMGKLDSADALTNSLQNSRLRYGVRSSFFLVGFFFTWIFGTANRITNLMGYTIYPIYVLHSVFTPLNGFINSLVYFSTFILKQKAKSRQKAKPPSLSLKSSHIPSSSEKSTHLEYPIPAPPPISSPPYTLNDFISSTSPTRQLFPTASSSTPSSPTTPTSPYSPLLRPASPMKPQFPRLDKGKKERRSKRNGNT